MSSGEAWVVVPAYNEAATLEAVIRRLQGQHFRVVVVDDGSTDRTAEIARAAGNAVLSHPFNLGQGAAIQTGIEYALGQGAQHVCTFDADGQHDPDELPVLVRALDRHQADYALGSRFLGTAVNMPTARRIVLWAATIFTRITTGLSVTDTHNGIRAMTRRGAEFLDLRQDRMAHGSEILMQIGRSGLRMVEVPVTVRYSAYTLGKGQRSSSALRVLADLAAGVLR